jgi:hypothetical protein
MLFTIGYRAFSASMNVNFHSPIFLGEKAAAFPQELGFHPQLPDLTLKLAQARSL